MYRRIGESTIKYYKIAIFLSLGFDFFSLTFSSLQGNQITGGIPEEYGNLSSLTMLDLESNKLNGQIPSSLGNLKNLQFL